MNKIVGFLILSALAFSQGEVLAQDLLGSQTLGETPPQFSYAAPDQKAPPGLQKMMLPPEEEIPEPIAEPLSTPLTSGELGSSPVDYAEDAEDDFRAFDCRPALLESSGTWLRRGFWYAQADAVVFGRTVKSGDLLVARDVSTAVNGGIKNQLVIDGTSCAEGAPRLNVGRFLFRDQANRDHTMEFTIFGGGNWGQDSQLTGGDLQMPPGVTNGNPSFDGAQNMNFDYTTWFNSFELTYNVKQRMNKDRMELEPSGHWVRRAQPSSTNAFLAGVRYFSLDEDMNINAFGIPDANGDSDSETGSYNLATGNHLIGTELGVSHAYETSRWSITGRVKGGMFLNMIHLKSNFDVTGNVTSGGADLEGDQLTFLGEAALIGRWHLRPNFSLRTSLEVLQVSGVSLAPGQVDFIPSGSPSLVKNSDVFYLGGGIGFESYW